MPHERSTIEVLVPTEVVGRQPGFLRIRPVIVDSSFLVADVLGAMREGRRTTFLEAVDFGALRPFAAHHVWAEMGRKVSDVPGEHGLDAQLAERIWWDEYVPRIRFVDVAGLPVPRADDILRRDRSDAPTVALAGLLAPVVVLAGDRDLTDLGVAAQNYRSVMRDAGVLTVVSQGSWASVAVLSGVIGLVAWAYGVLNRGLRHPLGQAAAVVSAVTLLLTADRWTPLVEKRIPGWWKQTHTVVTQHILPVVGEVVNAYAVANQGFEAAAFGIGDTSLIRSVAQALASSANPMTRTQLARQFLPNESETARRRLVKRLAPILEGYNAFSSPSRHRWALGRAGVDFGGTAAAGANVLAPGMPPALHVASRPAALPSPPPARTP